MLHKFSLVEYRYMHIYILFHFSKFWMTQLLTSHHLTFPKNLQSRYWTWTACKDPNSLAEARFPADNFEQWGCRRFTKFQQRSTITWRFRDISMSIFNLPSFHKNGGFFTVKIFRISTTFGFHPWRSFSADWPVDFLPWKNLRFHRHRCSESCQTVNANRMFR